METAAYVAMSRQTVLEQAMEVIANNLANASTSGFKGSEPLFRDYLQPGPGRQQIAYVRDAGSVRDIRQGDLKLTGNSLDAAIQGDGYYSVSTAAGVRYTRIGSFQTTPQGLLVTASGDPVLDDRGNPITLPTTPGRIAIGTDGTIAKNGTPVGKLGVVSFANPQQLVEESAGLYTTTAAPTPDATSRIQQGAIEQSNIRSVVEMTRMLSVQGAYADTVQVMSAEDTRLKNAIDKLSRVA
jgi:flagellar basal-body rod protein FlgF